MSGDHAQVVRDEAVHRDQGLAWALRASGDPAPLTDLAARARRHAFSSAAAHDARLARARRVLVLIELAAGAVMVVLALAALGSGNALAFMGSDVLAGDSGDTWVEAGWIAALAAVAAIVYAVIARAEPLAGVAPGRERQPVV